MASAGYTVLQHLTPSCPLTILCLPPSALGSSHLGLLSGGPAGTSHLLFPQHAAVGGTSCNVEGTVLSVQLWNFGVGLGRLLGMVVFLKFYACSLGALV